VGGGRELPVDGQRDRPGGRRPCWS
jgi:hypothetical protein